MLMLLQLFYPSYHSKFILLFLLVSLTLSVGSDAARPDPADLKVNAASLISQLSGTHQYDNGPGGIQVLQDRLQIYGSGVNIR